MSLSRDDRTILELIATGWRPLTAQVASWRRLESRGLLRVDWGPEDTPDADRPCLYLTDKGREAINAG
jgi:DNA-binding PadR family transcriptional regulator